MKQLIILGILVLFAGIKLSAQNTDSSDAKYIAEQLLDSSTVYGIFETPGMQEGIHQLKSGIVPELQDGYLEVMIKNMLSKLNTIKPLKGEFDSIIYVKTPTYESDAELPIQFFPYPKSKWFLIMHSPFDVFGQPKPEWIIHLDKPKVKGYLNPLTVFENVSIYRGNVCLNWDKTYQPPYGLKIASAGFEQDIESITKALAAAPKGSEVRMAKLKELQASLKTELGKEVVVNLK